MYHSPLPSPHLSQKSWIIPRPQVFLNSQNVKDAVFRDNKDAVSGDKKDTVSLDNKDAVSQDNRLGDQCWPSLHLDHQYFSWQPLMATSLNMDL